MSSRSFYVIFIKWQHNGICSEIIHKIRRKSRLTGCRFKKLVSIFKQFNWKNYLLNMLLTFSHLFTHLESVFRYSFCQFSFRGILIFFLKHFKAVFA